MTMDLTLYLRDPLRQRVGQIDDFETLTLNPKWNDVGKWVVKMDRRAPLAAYLMTPGYGIEAVRPDGTVMSGMLLNRSAVRTKDDNTIEVHGVDDLIWLKYSLAHPEPGSSVPPYSTNEYDVRTAQASSVLIDYVSVNRGPTALVPRRVPGLTMAANPAIGTTVTGRARWQVLLTFLQELAVSGGDIGFEITQSGTNLVFSVYQGTDRTASVKFSEENGTLAAFDYSADAPEATYVYCGGGGEGTARTVQEGQDSDAVATWGRFEMFRDRRDTTDVTELTQTILEELAQTGEKVGLSITPIDVAGQTYGTHYGLGDRVTVVIDDVVIQEVIREVTLSYTPDGPQIIKPVIGTVARPTITSLFASVARAALDKVRNLERR